jgi:hypothetical protein
MIIWDRWQAPDRDSPATATIKATVELGTQLSLLLRMEGRSGTREEEVKEVTGDDLRRSRRWHKIFERMGLLYLGADGRTHLTDLGRALVDAERNTDREIRRGLARKAVRVLRKYQLRNPADEGADERYPEDCNLHPYWAIWKAAVELGGRLHWDELNRVLMRVLLHADLDAAIERIAEAREQPDYDPKRDGSSSLRLGDRCYEQTEAPAGRDPEGQIRDQKTTPWFRRAGLGQLLLESPGGTGDGYWSIPDDMLDILREEVRRLPPFREFSDKEDWFAYYGSLGEIPVTPLPEHERAGEIVRLLLERHNVVLYGPPGTGKTHAALSVEREWTSRYGSDTVYKVTFHPSYSYEDFVQGFRPVADRPGDFALEKGVLLRACDAARELAEQSESAQEASKVLLIIDEINRGDVARIFGELITYIEPDKRGVPCRLAQSPGKPFWMPENIYFLGTMNTADKSISLLDVALRRRFAFVEFPPDAGLFDRLDNWLSEIGGVALGQVLNALNERLLAEGIETDRAIGHSLLFVSGSVDDPIDALRQRIRLDILPLIAEYCYMDRTRVRRVVGDLVDENGRLRELGDDALVEALASIIGFGPVSEQSVAVDEPDNQDDSEGETSVHV